MWELASRYVAKGIFEAPQDFAMLMVSDWNEAFEGSSDTRNLVGLRKAESERLANLEPPFIVDSFVPPLSEWREKATANSASAQVIVGLPGCAGVYKGRARVISDPTDLGDLQPADILIARHTDPSWTPLFSAVSAVVVDVGATISHAVIVARELGVPCVTSATDATSLIPDGALIEVNGSTGTVTIL